MNVAVLIYFYIAVGANQVCQEGVCECARGFARNNDNECVGKFLLFSLYSKLYNWVVKDCIYMMISF